MGFHSHRSIRIGPGLRINLSKSGVSESVGTRGAWFTIGPRGTRETVGLPGTGLSYTEQQRTPAADIPSSTDNRSNLLAIVLLIALLENVNRAMADEHC